MNVTPATNTKHIEICRNEVMCQYLDANVKNEGDVSPPSIQSELKRYRCGHCGQQSNWKHVIEVSLVMVDATFGQLIRFIFLRIDFANSLILICSGIADWCTTK